MTARPAPRANREGHPCPPWCVTDHDEVHGVAGPFRFHGSALAAIRLCGDSIGARAMHDGTPRGEPGVLVTGLDRAAEPALWVKPCAAEHLAGLVEMLADASPDQHRELAGAIRAAAAVIAAASEMEPERGSVTGRLPAVPAPCASSQQARAACRGTDPDLFFPPDGGRPTRLRWRSSLRRTSWGGSGDR